MKILPAIDLIGGRCVRLAQGDFSRETTYPNSPQAALKAFEEEGAEEAHLVDLDGARAGEPRQHALFLELVQQTSLKLQVAGGFRSSAHVARMLDAGVSRVVIGSLAIREPHRFAAMIAEFGPDRLTLALDVRMKGGTAFVASHGWMVDSGERLDDLLAAFPAVRHLLVTDIDRDGMLTGPNLDLVGAIRANWPELELQASGGVADLTDLDLLRHSGAARAIVGKAIWEGRFTLSEGVARVSS